LFLSVNFLFSDIFCIFNRFPSLNYLLLILIRIVTIPSIALSSISLLNFSYDFVFSKISASNFGTEFSRSFNTTFSLVSYCTTICAGSFSKLCYDLLRCSTLRRIVYVDTLIAIYSPLMLKCFVLFGVINIPGCLFNVLRHVSQVDLILFLHHLMII